MSSSRGYLLDIDDSYRYGPRSRRRDTAQVKGFIALSVALASVCLLVLVGKSRTASERGASPRTGSGRHGMARKAFKGTQLTEGDVGITGVTAINSYSTTSPVDISVYPWDLVVEPYRDTTLTVQASGLNLSSSSVEAGWSITGPAPSAFSYSGTGTQVVVQFTGVGRYQLTVSLLNKSTGATYSYTAQPMCKYVRREIRALSPEDREAFLDALHTVYTVSTTDGQKLYGAGYRDMASFVKKHLYGAADRECDHWHDDAGIVNHHVAYTLELEQVLQTICPSVSVPYWEYTIDAMLDSWEDSPIFGDDWFGVASPDNEEHVVSTGRWAYTPILSDASAFSRFTNPYGLLRSPWNTNPTPYFTRYHYLFGTDSFYWPTCEHFSSCYNETSFAAISLCLNGYTHGPVHIKIGGEWGMSDEDVSTADDYGFLVPYLLFVKNLWRHGVVSCPISCEEGATCACGLTPGVLEKKTAYEILGNYTGIMGQLSRMSGSKIYYDDTAGRYRAQGVAEEDEDALWTSFVEVMSDPHHAGEMYTSAAPYDPTFWVIHPTAERLLNAKRISVALHGTTFDETWGYDHEHKAASDTGQVCVWSDVSQSDDGEMPKCVRMLCDGHHEYDVLPFNKFKSDKSDLLYTNALMYRFIHPFSEDLPYLYDNYRWDHCADTYPINI